MINKVNKPTLEEHLRTEASAVSSRPAWPSSPAPSRAGLDDRQHRLWSHRLPGGPVCPQVPENGKRGGSDEGLTDVDRWDRLPAHRFLLHLRNLLLR